MMPIFYYLYDNLSGLAQDCFKQFRRNEDQLNLLHDLIFMYLLDSHDLQQILHYNLLYRQRTDKEIKIY